MSRSWLSAWSLRCTLTVALMGCEGAILSPEADGGGLSPVEPDAAGNTEVEVPRSDGGRRDSSVAPSDAGAVTTSAPADVCSAPIARVDTSKPTTVVGTGPGTCTEQLLEEALKKGGIITFNCGDSATIAISREKVFASGVDTTLDGAGKVTLDGQKKTRILSFSGPDFQKTKTKLTLQGLRLINGKATGSKRFAMADPPCSQGFQDGSGGAVFVNDGDLRVLGCTFENNEAASPGPDVGGGAIYAQGTVAATVVGSIFRKNQGSNGGAIGALFGNLSVYNSLFEDNQATGTGANSINDSCPEVEGQREVGSGGNGGAIVMDGGEEFSVVICGSIFRRNLGGEGAFGGALFRTPDVAVQSTLIDRCTFDGNESGAGGALYFHHSKLTIEASTFANNVGNDGTGAIQVDDTVLSVTNSTFSGNKALRAKGAGGGPRGGAITDYGTSGTVQNCTFFNNSAPTGDGQTGGALIVLGASSFVVNNSLFVDNQSLGPSCTATTSGAGDLQWPSESGLCVEGATMSDPVLGALQDNGGPTHTLLPAAAGPADKSGSDCPKTDQRGYARAVECSLGAVEIGASKN
ncbi:MAG: uncharacterized protein JWN48_2279 [Myxococcaceae bacterium]|nr:uncharacterized protein [Myxococcaceae bacterium]